MIDKKLVPFLHKFRCGIERETLRIDSKGRLSQKGHPKGVGSPLTHPYIGTDFGEQQLEWNTPPKKSFKAAEKFLEEIIHFTLEKMGGELFWPFSMPCHLDRVEIAKYGSSHEGRKKEIYREGLKGRYGEKLQMVSGIHFNFSFDRSFWKAFHKVERSKLPLQKFIDEKYLETIRNFLREGWILTYLFGASPAMDPSYAPLPKGFIKEEGAYLGPHATSIRMSSVGYYSRVQSQLAISFNSLDEYIEDMKRALSIPRKKYAKIKTQLNDHLLQIENEHYSRIRPKSLSKEGETPLQALEKRGIEYLEVRAIDLDPYHPTGMGREQIDFLHQFLLYCLFKKSPPFSAKCQICLTESQNKVALEGRKRGLLLGGVPLKKLGKKILKGMEPIAKELKKEKNLKEQMEKIENPSCAPSALLERDIREHGFLKMGLKLAKLHKKTFLASKLRVKKAEDLEEEVSRSLVENTRLETAAEILVSGYEDLELSTQILIREAIKRNVSIEILDRKDQFLRLERDGHVEYVKEATKTSKDPYITAHLLENKQVTKIILEREGLRVPEGKSYNSQEEAFLDYPLYEKKKIVVKPKSTNFGVGIHFISPCDEKHYKKSVENAFTYGNTVLVEEFCPGEEFRFLVIDGKVIGVAKRVPAHVIGNGNDSIQKLVHNKNHDPTYYRDPKTTIHLGPDEKRLLKSQNLSPSSVPRKGKKVFLRHNSNVSTGGDAIDVTDVVHRGYSMIAIKATEALGAKICGVDMILPKPQSPPTKSNYSLIELNYNPVLFIHAYPYKGKRRDVASPLLDLLGYSK